MQLVITNTGTSPIYLSDFYTNLVPGASITTSRFEADLSRMKSVQDALAAGTITMVTTPTANEMASGMLAGLGVSEPVSSTTKIGDEFDIRWAFTAGAAGAPDDVTVYALNTVPFKFRVLDMYGVISTALAGTIQAQPVTGGAGTILGEISSTATGHQTSTATVTTTQVVTPGSSVGLFLRRSDRGVAGEVVLHCRREA